MVHKWVGAHGLSISGEQERVGWCFSKCFQISHQFHTVLEAVRLGRSKRLEWFVDCLAQGLEWAAAAGADGSGLERVEAL